jgi:CheY-like chemotaxis protein
VTAVPDAAAALQMLRERRTDCVIAGADVPDLASTLLAAGEAAEPAVGRLPIILFGDGAAHPDGTGEWKRLADTCTVNCVHSAERLLDLTSFFLHLPVANLPENQRQLLLELHQSDKLLAGKKVLIVDDDMRNIFALSTLLEEHEMVISSADNGRDAIRILRGDPEIDIVLMDIMMPEMDGLETMREIRKNPTLKNLPIVAVTAKAMKGDREKCIEAGAWDYLSKPVDTEQMLAVLRAWLHR